METASAGCLDGGDEDAASRRVVSKSTRKVGCPTYDAIRWNGVKGNVERKFRDNISDDPGRSATTRKTYDLLPEGEPQAVDWEA